MRWIAWIVAWLGFTCLAWAAGDTNPMNYDPLVREAYNHFYNLDYTGAIQRFERFRAEHPGDPQATAYLLEAVLFQELYRQDLLDTTFYANDGFLTGKHATRPDPEARKRIMGLADEAIREADARIGKNPNDANALFVRGWVRSLQTTYLAMVERDFRGGFKYAFKARDDEQRVLQIDPNYVNAKLVLGVYQYVVGALPWPFKILVGFAGITGSKTTGMAMLRDAGERGVNTSVEARTVIALFLRREGKYKEAIEVVRKLKAEYPHDFLFHLEEANLRKDAGERSRMLNGADVVILCLPDDAAREAVGLIDNPAVKIIDASTAYRTAEDWTYGFAEMAPGQRAAIAAANRVSNPGCYPTGFIGLVAPLVREGLLPADWPVTATPFCSAVVPPPPPPPPPPGQATSTALNALTTSLEL